MSSLKCLIHFVDKWIRKSIYTFNVLFAVHKSQKATNWRIPLTRKNFSHRAFHPQFGRPFPQNDRVNRSRRIKMRFGRALIGDFPLPFNALASLFVTRFWEQKSVTNEDHAGERRNVFPGVVCHVPALRGVCILPGRGNLQVASVG